MTRARFPALAGALLLAGCTFGPRYKGPPAAVGGAVGGAAFARAEPATTAPPPLARWWQALADPVLDRLEADALAANPDLAAAAARVARARGALREQRAAELPSASASALYAHADIPGLNFGQVQEDGQGQPGGSTALNIYNLGLTTSWEIDLFGGGRRAIEAARAGIGGAEADLADAQVTVTAGVAQAYLDARDRQRRIALNDRAIAKQQQMLDLLRQRQERGVASRQELDRRRQQLDAARADNVPLRAELDAFLDALATLCGRAPGAVDALMTPPRPAPLPPASVAVGDPAALIRRRPDIRAAERTLAADTARIGQQISARFPKLSMMGIIGIGGSRVSDLTNLDDFTSILAPQISFSFLDFGKGAARVRQARAVRDEAEANYRAAVLAALKEVNDSLSRFRNRRVAVATLARAERAARASAAASRERYAAGTATLIDALDDERQQLAAEQRLASAEAALTGDFIAIEKALGLGWGAPAPAGGSGRSPASESGGA